MPAFPTVLNVAALNGVNGFRINQGGRVSDAGDVNGDGTSDLIVGAKLIFGGQVFGASFDASNLAASQGRDFEADDPFDLSAYNTFGYTWLSGFAVDYSLGAFAVGDINNDGRDDLAFGAAAVRATFVDPKELGRLVIAFGAADIGTDPAPDIGTTEDASSRSAGVVDALEASGGSPSLAGQSADFNGDGLDDFADIRGDLPPYGSFQHRGISRVYEGEAASDDNSTFDILTHEPTGTPDTWNAKESLAYLTNFGSADIAGDITGDGYADALFGGQFGIDLHTGIFMPEQQPYTRLVHGRSTAPDAPLVTTGSVTPWQRAEAGYTYFGDSSSYQGTREHEAKGLGDINGDGIGDFAIGVADTQNGRSVVHVVFGRSGFGFEFDLATLDGTNGFRFSEAFVGGLELGTSVAPVGDVNGDGIDDMIVGAPGADFTGAKDAGAAYVIFGSANGFLSDFSPSDLGGGTGFIIRGSQADQRLGTGVAGAGDLNDDGTSDIYVGTQSGETFVVHGDATASATKQTGGTGNDSLVGSPLDDQLYGVAGADTLVGMAGNDLLDGGTGADSMVGGPGDDTYVLDDPGDQIVETGPASDRDTVRTLFDFSVAGTGIENVTLFGSGNVTATGDGSGNILTGNLGNNSLVGGGGSDVLRGLGGNDTLEGGNGGDLLDGGVDADLMRGGNGGDYYFVDDPLDVIEETGPLSEIDTVRTSVSFDLQGTTLDNMQIDGGSVFAGNDLNNIITVLSSGTADSFYGRGGNDVIDASRIASDLLIDGGTGADDMRGGSRNDRFIVDDLGDTVFGSGGRDTVESSVDFSLAGTGVTALELTGSLAIGGTGNDLNNYIDGNGADNHLEGGIGDDTLYGNRGSDTLLGGAGDDSLFGDNLSFTGMSENFLDGGAGADTMRGGFGSDVYVVDDAGDQIVDPGNVDTDEIRSSIDFSLAGYAVEILTLTGTATNATGNSLANILNGTGAANVLDGNGGENTLRGGAGNDIYRVRSETDVVEDFGAPTDIDTVQSFTDRFELAGTGVENLWLRGDDARTGIGTAAANLLTGNDFNNLFQGFGGRDAIRGLGGDDVIEAGNGDDFIDGGTGADTMRGGFGSDIYVVDNPGDTIEETGPLGDIDEVRSSVSFSLLGQILDNLTLTGTAAINGTGNSLANVIKGNAGSNILTGGFGQDWIEGGPGDDRLRGDTGVDVLIGGSGKDLFWGGAQSDVFVFRSASDIGATTATRDVIFDFAQGADKMNLVAVDAVPGGGDDSFAFLGAGPFSGTAGELRSTAIGPNTLIEGDTDGDGAGDFELVLIGNHALTAGDFFL